MDLTGENMNESASDAGRPSKLKIASVTRNIKSPLIAETRVIPEETPSDSKIRLSTDIDEQAYISLKCYAAINRKSVVSILNDLIYTHCPVKIST